MDHSTDSQLIQAVRKGSNESFRLLVVRYQQLVFAVCFGVTKNHADAEDAAQEAFLKFYNHIDQYDITRPLKPWLLTIAMNCSRNIVKKNLRMRTAGENELQLKASKEGSAMAGISKSEKFSAIRNLVAQLPRTMREVCSLFYLAQCTCKEIGEILNLSESSVKVNLHRSRQKLLENGIAQWRTA